MIRANSQRGAWLLGLWRQPQSNALGRELRLSIPKDCDMPLARVRLSSDRKTFVFCNAALGLGRALTSA